MPPIWPTSCSSVLQFGVVFAGPRVARPRFGVVPVVAALLGCAAATMADDGRWRPMAASIAELAAANPERLNVRPDIGRAYELKTAETAKLVAGLQPGLQPGAQPDPGGPAAITIDLPMPDGTFETFTLSYREVMAPELQTKFPEITPAEAVSVAHPTWRGTVVLTPAGLHAMIDTPEGVLFVDPLFRGENTVHTAYWRSDYRTRGMGRFACLSTEPPVPVPPLPPVNPDLDPGLELSGPTLRTYRLAVAATGEYTAYHGGTVPLGLAAVTVAAARVDQIYRREFAVSLQLVSNNNLLIYTSAATDPYTDNNANAMLSQNQSNLTTVIGTANFDVGHVFARMGGGGVASLGSVCVAGRKAQGVTSIDPPIGDPFSVDYVAHEIGHQFNGTHCFNSCTGSDGGAGVNGYEPGSGSTIMAYAGICGANNLQPNSDPFFHAVSHEQVMAFIATAGCGASTATGNAAPVVNTTGAGGGLTIPRATPFTLTASATDPNSDVLSFLWEQRDSGIIRPLGSADPGNGPMSRSRVPGSEPSRTVPPMTNVLSGVTDPADRPAAAGRAAYRWRLTARDNLGGVGTGDVTLAVSATAGPFVTTGPVTGQTVAGILPLRWNPAGTTNAPISTAQVRVLLSTDNGATFPLVLAAAAANTGTADILIPGGNSSASARVKIEAVGNIYFAVTPAFNLLPTSAVALTLSGGLTADDSIPGGNNNGKAEPGEGNISITASIQNIGLSSSGPVSVTLTPLAGTNATPPLPGTISDIASGATGIVTLQGLTISAAQPCGSLGQFTLTATAAGFAPTSFPVSLPIGVAGGTTTQTFAYSGPPGAIPTDSPRTRAITVSGYDLAATVTDVNFVIGGTNCSSAAGATGVGISHTNVGDLQVDLISPSGIAVNIMNQPGGGARGASGNNFCQATFDDDGGFLNVQAISVTASGPFTGGFAPASPLSVFDGRSPNGDWLVRYFDVFAAADIGTFRAASVVLSVLSGPVCAPPIPTTVCLADRNRDGTVDGDDFIAFINAFSAGELAADLVDGGGSAPGDGVVDGSDFVAFVNAFGAGC